jgi:hypothetical protein
MAHLLRNVGTAIYLIDGTSPWFLPDLSESDTGVGKDGDEYLYPL